MSALKLKAEEIIDPGTGIHYAYHKSLKTITAAHTHDFYEFFLIVKGKALHNINGRSEIIDEGTLVFMRPADVHSYEKHGDEKCELINIAFTGDTLFKLLDYFGTGYHAERLLNAQYPPYLKLTLPDKESLVQKFRYLNTLPRKNKEEIKTEFRMLIAEVFSRYFTGTKKKYDKNIPAWLYKVKEEMELKENFTAGINRMNEISGRSQEHLSREFKKYFKETPTGYITHLRLNYAANMLVNSDQDITEIALDAGFENLSHFYHLFKKHFNISPREFRQKNQTAVIPV